MAKNAPADAVDWTEFYPKHLPFNDNGVVTCTADGQPWPCPELVGAGYTGAVAPVDPEPPGEPTDDAGGDA
jgi:hypothetical protein